MVRQGLVAVLSADSRIDVAGTASSFAEVRSALGAWRCDVLVTDYTLADGTGADVARFARSEAPNVSTIVISGQPRARALEEAVDAGCAGFVSKTLSAGELADAIITVARGASVFPVGALRRLSAPDKTRPGATLTAREIEVLQLLSRAVPAPEIADHLTLSTHTARNHIRSILTKLGARSQLEAVVIAVRAGLVEIESD